MYSIVSTAIVRGIESIPIRVEADVTDGMPVFEMVGFLSAEVREARERVRTALKNCGYRLPPKRITINLSPAYVRKSGSSFDLPVAVAVLAAMGIIPKDRLEQLLIVGEVGLDGRIKPIHGVLPIVTKAAQERMDACMVPVENAKEAALLKAIRLFGVNTLEEVIKGFNDEIKFWEPEKEEIGHEKKVKRKEVPDFSEINGQQFVKRACEIAVSGRHNLLMIGPPGAGKTMIARRIPGILPKMTEEEALEVTKIYSVRGLLTESEAWMAERPFRNPHHTITPQGLAGGGMVPGPGEISLAHHGVLFLDELAEFRRETLEILRQPMEEHCVKLARLAGNYEFPSDFMLVAAMNPCRCGYYPDLNRCHCTKGMVEQYLKKISQPLLDRIDICVETKRVEYQDLIKENPHQETSAEIRKRVVAAMERQQQRFAGTNIRYNSRIPAALLTKYCRLSTKQKQYMESIYQKLELTARSYHRILRVARTIADMDGSDEILTRHLSEAVCYRNVDKKFWEG